METYYQEHIDELLELFETVKDCACPVVGCDLVVLDKWSYDSFKFVVNNVIDVLKKIEVQND